MTTTTENVRLWSVTTGTANAAVDAGISSSDAQSPDTVDNNIRSLMTAHKRESDDQGGWIVATGTATALIVATASGMSTAMLANGLRLCVRTASAATGAATIAVDAATAADIKRSDGAAIGAGDWVAGQIIDLVYSSTATAFLAMNIGNNAINGLTADATPDQTADYVATYDASVAGHKKVLLQNVGGMGLLASGTVAAAALSIVLTSYTGYRGIKIFLSGFKPATDDVALFLRFSTDGGANYAASGYNVAYFYTNDHLGSVASGGSGSDSAISLTAGGGAGLGVGNGAAEGYNGEITILNQTSTAFWSRAQFSGYYINAEGTPAGSAVYGGGAKEAAQDTDAVQFLFSSGNIAAGNYAVYGLL